MYLWSQFTYYFIWLSFLAIIASIGLYIFLALIVISWATLWWYHIPQLPEYQTAAVLGPADEGSSKPMQIVHRGAGNDAPENTIEAFELAKKNGADGMEFDLEFTADGYPIIMHDDTLDRTTDGMGSIRDHTLEDIKKLNAAAKDKNRESYGKVKIPELEEAVAVCLRLKMKMFIDCKRSSAETIVSLSQLFSKYPDLYKEAMVCSFYPNIIYRVRKADPNILTALNHRHQVYTKVTIDGEDRHPTILYQMRARVIDFVLEIGHYIFLWYLCGTSAFLMNRDSYSGIFHRFWKKRGVRVFVWTVNDPNEKEYLMKTRNCSIITDTLL